MTRSNLSTANQEAVAENTVRAVMLLDIAFPSGTLRATTAERPVVYSGQRYEPSGVFNEASGFSENIDLKAQRVVIKMSGVDAGLITKLMDDAYSFAEVNCYLGLCDETWRLVDDPYPLGDSLLMSGAVITLDQGTGSVEVSAESLDILNARSSAQLATNESQQLRYSGDTGMIDVRAIMEMEIEWGGRVYGGSRVSGFGGPGEAIGTDYSERQ